MSDRTWLSRTQAVPERWKLACDHALNPTETLEQFARRVAWKLPAKLYGDDPALLREFLYVLDREFSMPPDEFWEIGIEGNSAAPLSHPTWQEVETYLGIQSRPA